MTAKQMADIIGKRAYIRSGTLEVEVTIVDIKSAYGNTRYQVAPVKGFGNTWVESIILKEKTYATMV